MALTPFHSKPYNSSSLICHLSRTNLFGPYSILHKSPKFQFTHLPFIQIQSYSTDYPLRCPTYTHLMPCHSSTHYTLSTVPAESTLLQKLHLTDSTQVCCSVITHDTHDCSPFYNINTHSSTVSMCMLLLKCLK